MLVDRVMVVGPLVFFFRSFPFPEPIIILVCTIGKRNHSRSHSHSRLPGYMWGRSELILLSPAQIRELHVCVCVRVGGW